MKVTIVIPNYNGKHFMEPCLSSLSEQTYKNFHILVVDNASSDGSIEYMEENYPDIELIKLQKNFGFSKAVNIGIQHSRTPYVILLNNDTTVDTRYVEEMVRLGGIKAEEAKNHPDKNIITRAMGVKEEVEADIYEYRLKKGDMILMCTDGLSNMVEDEDMFDIVKGARDIVEAVQMLIEKANSNGGRDNIGVVLAEPLADEVSAW